MEITTQVLLFAFIGAVVMGAVVNKTNFCTMGAVSDWVNMGDLGRIRAWLFAMALALAGVLLLEAASLAKIESTFPPYRTASFAWLRYALGGFLFGIGMTFASGCGQKTLIRIGGGNLKSVVVLVIAGFFAYLMTKTNFYNDYFASWINPTTIDLSLSKIAGQDLGSVVNGLFGVSDAATLRLVIGGIMVLGLLAFVFRSADFRGNFDNVFGGLVVGLVVVGGWYLTGGPMGDQWKDAAMFAEQPPFGVATQSYTFINPMADTAMYLMSPKETTLITFGVVALAGVIVGSLLYALISRSFRFEWFASFSDFSKHAVGAVLMGVGGVLSMGCTIGQAVTGVSTLAMGSFLTFFAIVFGSALTMKVQYYMLDEQGFFGALRSSLADLKLLPAPKKA